MLALISQEEEVCVCVLGGGGGLYLTLGCHHQNDSALKTGRGKSLFSVSFIVRTKVTKAVSVNHNFKEKGEPKRELGVRVHECVVC